MKKSLVVSICMLMLTSCSVVTKNGYRQSRKYNISKVHFTSGNKENEKASTTKSQHLDTSFLTSKQQDANVKPLKQSQEITSLSSKNAESSTQTNQKVSDNNAKPHLTQSTITKRKDNTPFKFEKLKTASVHKSNSLNKKVKLKHSSKSNSAASPSSLFTVSVVFGVLALILLLTLAFVAWSSTLGTIMIWTLFFALVLTFIFALLGLPKTLREAYSVWIQLIASLWTLLTVVGAGLAFVLYLAWSY